MRKKSKKKGSGILWIPYACFLPLVACAFILGNTLSGILMAVAALLLIPLPSVCVLRKEVKFSRLAIGIAAVLLMFMSMFVIPAATGEYIPHKDASVNDTVAAEPNITETEITEPEISESVTTEPEETEPEPDKPEISEPAPTPAPEPEITETEPEEVKSTFSILFIDVGQADSALVECDGHYMLIDGGNKADSDLIYTVLKDRNIDHLDIIVGSHADEDHIGGLAGALNFAKADVVLCPVLDYESKAFKNFAKYADQNGNGIKVPQVGDTYQLGSAQISILAVNTSENSNDTSIVLKIQYGETSFLFVGDAEELTEETLVDANIDISATVLKVGHHGAKTSTSEEFLKAVSPAYAVISVGEKNDYGHPTADVLLRLKEKGVVTYRTDMQGDIFCTSDGITVTFKTEKNGDADVFAAVENEEKTDSETETVVPEPEPEPEPEPTPTPDPSQQTYNYVLNTNTGKFHWPDCRSVDEMNEANKWFYTGTRESVIEMGYSSCGNCNP